MSEKIEATPAAADLDIENDIGAEAAAILEFTSNIGEAKPTYELTFITSKAAFIWAGFAVEIAQSRPNITNINIQASMYRAIDRLDIRKESRGYYSYDPTWIAYDSISRGFLEAISYTEEEESSIEDLMTRIHGNSIHNAQAGYSRCFDLGLISDPIIELTMGLAIVGLIPFSIVKRTKDGQVVYKKIQAGLWKYERDKGRGRIEHTSITFEAARIARVLKVALVSAYHEATKGEGDEPE